MCDNDTSPSWHAISQRLPNAKYLYCTLFFLHSSLCIWASVWTLFYELYMQCFLDIGGNGRLMVKSLSGQVVTAP